MIDKMINTLGIGLVWLVPYFQVSMCEFYLKINGSKTEKLNPLEDQFDGQSYY